MYYLLFSIYLLLGTYLLMHIPFIKKSGLSPKFISALFIIKVISGLFIGWVTQRYYPGNDYWGLHYDGLVEYDLLKKNPQVFFTNIFKSPYENGYGGFFDSVGSYWNDLRYNIILKILAVFDIFSRGNFYINTLFFNFFGFFGPVALFRVFSYIYKRNQWPAIVGCFLLPSTLYFTSAIHKDLIVFTMLGLYCYALYFSVVEGHHVKRWLLMFVTLIIILLIRNYVAIALFPATVAFIWVIKKRTKPFFRFIAVYLSLLLLAMALQLFIPSFQPLSIITKKQADFSDIPVAASQLTMHKLEPNLKSFIQNLPQAIDHGFFRPFTWHTWGTFQFPLAIELLFYEILFVLFLLKSRQKAGSPEPFTLFAVFFACSMLLITGYIIPNMGAIARYKSIYLPFLMTPLLYYLFRKKEG